MTVTKAPFELFPNRLKVNWDVATCTDAQGYELLFGEESDLPMTYAGPYGLSGGLCSIGTTGSFNWNNPPCPLPGEFNWFLIVAHDDMSDEGSWGKNSGPLERNGLTSSVCKPVKSLTNNCGQ